MPGRPDPTAACHRISIARHATPKDRVTLRCACCGEAFARAPSLVGSGLTFKDVEHKRRYFAGRRA